MALIDHVDVIALRKIGNPSGWEVVCWEAIDGSDGMLVAMAPVKIGPRGGKKYGKDRKRTFVSRLEAESELLGYESATGNCGECMGNREVYIGWNRDSGTRVGTCPRCTGTGKAVA